MFSEILKIQPRLDGKDLNSMERTLNTRFKRVAKSFGGGLLSAIKGGGIVGLATTLIDKVLNPLKEVQESIDKSLSKGDDLATYAKQFNTTAGNLARLQAFGQATGLEAEGVRLLLGKFQASVAQAEADPSKRTAVSNFVGRKDTAEAFFEFIQSMQALSPTQQNLVQQEVFGEKQILKASEFLNADFKQLAKDIGGPSAEALTIAANQLGALNDIRDTFRARRDLQDLEKKAQLIGPNTIKGVLQGEKVDLDRENKRLAQFDDLKKISMSTDKLVKLLEDGYLKLAPYLAQVIPAAINEVVSTAKVIEKSRSLRGLVPGKDN